MDARERILERLRKAAPTDKPECPPVSPDAAVFADMPDNLIECFANQLATLHGEFYRVESLAAAASRVRELLAAVGEGKALRQSSAFLDDLVAEDEELAGLLEVDRVLPSQEMAAYAAGVTEADALIARTGSVVLRNTTGGGRRLSVLPPLHIVIARASLLVPSIEDALVKIGDGGWSYATIISGPSRTADIEKILVLGAHGPKRLVVILVDAN